MMHGMTTPRSPLAIVTGAAHRLGKSLALALARRGYAILLHYHRADSLAAQTAAEIEALGVPVYPVRADLTDPAQVDFLFSAVDNLPHPLEVLVNSAAVMTRGNVRDLPLTDWNAALDLNLRAPFLMAQRAAQRMRAGGLIVNITDVGARKTWSAYPAYTVSKAALESLTRVLARALAPDIRVNAVAPGLVLPAADMSPEAWQTLTEKMPLRRTARPEEIAAALDFLLDNRFVTGETITVDGGYSLI